jgi:predicted nucleic acid-binding protein
MAVYFFDSSALVKRYVSETGTAWVVSLLDPTAGNVIHIARLAGAEVVSAIARRGRSGDLDASDATTAITQFRREFASVYRPVEITPVLIQQAMDPAEIRALRGYDAVQLAAALEVDAYYLVLGMPALRLVSADAALNAAATAEGLAVEDPNSH